MTRITVSLDDPLAEALKLAAGGDGKVSGWVASLIREKLLAAAGSAAGAFDRAHDAPDWEDERMAGARE